MKASVAVVARLTLPQRLFPLPDAGAVDRLLQDVEWCAIFKAGTSDSTFDAWELVQKALEPRVDVAVGLITLPAGRAASDRVSALSGITHKSPQLVLFRHGKALGHLDEREIDPASLTERLRQWLPPTIGPAVDNPAVVSIERYRVLVAAFVSGEMAEERFQWGYLDRLAREAGWRDDESFALLNSLFENPAGRDVHPARLVAIEFQGQLAGRLDPLKVRAERLLERL